MKLRKESGLLMLTITLENGEQSLTLSQVVVDTGSVSTIFATEKVSQIGIEFELNDEIDLVSGIGGTESVILKTIGKIVVEAEAFLENFPIEIGAMDYGFDLDGIIGLDFLERVGAIIDVEKAEITFKA